MGELLSRVLPLSLGAAVSPTVLAVELLILSSPTRPLRRGLLYLLGVLTVLGGLVVLALTVMRHAPAAASGTDHEVTVAIDLFAGILLLLLAVGTVLRSRVRPDAPGDDPAAPPPSAERHTGLGGAWLLGVVLMATNFTTILLFLPAMRDVARSTVDGVDKALVTALVVVVTAAAAWLPLLVRVVVPGPASRWFASMHRFVAAHQRAIGVAVEVVFGVYLVAKAL